MFGQLVVFFTISICLTLSAGLLNSSHNVYCRPVLSIVPVKEDGLPHFVKLHRCHGSLPHFKPHLKTCTVDTSSEVPVEVNVPFQSDPKIVMLKNHTSCKGQCTRCPSNLMSQDENTCDCKCEHSQNPEGKCPDNHGWDGKNCKCSCSLEEYPSNHQLKLDKKKCQHVCNRKCSDGKVGDPKRRCRCVDGVTLASTGSEDSDNMSEGELIAAVVVGEFFVLYLIFDSILYSRKAGLMYYVKCKCRGKPAAVAQTQPEATRCLENRDEMNNIPLADVRIDQNGHSHVAPGSSQHVSST